MSVTEEETKTTQTKMSKKGSTKLASILLIIIMRRSGLKGLI